MIWTRISLLLCVFGFLKELKPSAPFTFEYLTGPWKNFTREQIYQEVIPVTTYSYFATLLPVLLLTDFLRYKPVIILCGLSGTCSQIILTSAESLWAMKVVNIFTGLSFSTEVAYFAYIYAKVDKKHYQEVTSHILIALLLGRFVGSVTAQCFISFGLLDYHQLNYLTLLGIVLGTIWTFFLPSVDRSIYLDHTTVCGTSESLPPQVENEIIKLKRSTNQLYYSQLALESDNRKTSPSLRMTINNTFYILWKDFLSAYSRSYVLKWSAWWVIFVSGWMQVISYIQVLWETSFRGTDDVYNAATDASKMVLGALVTFGVGKLKINFPVIGEAILAVFTLIQGILLLVAANTYNIWLSYTACVGFCVIHQAILIIASSEIAKNLPENSYGLVIGFNTLLALILQSILTFTVTESWSFALGIRQQYVVYGSCFILMSAIFMAMAIYTIAKQCRSDKQFHLWEQSIPLR